MAYRGWPPDWHERKAGKDCPLCAALGRGDNAYSVAVWTGQLAEVWLEPSRTCIRTWCPATWTIRPQAAPIEWAQIHSAGPVPEAELHRQAAGLRALLAG